jgi:hypothetical protein
MFEVIMSGLGGLIVSFIAGPFATIFMVFVDEPRVDHAAAAVMLALQWWGLLVLVLMDREG